jgi:MYXO-CTERM domain-containing protein
LWPGLSNPTSDLIQTTMDSWSGTENSSYCSGNGSQWCVEASVFGSFGQTNGPTVAIDADDQVTIEYALGADNETWTQTVTSQKLGKVVSTLQTAAGEMLGSGFGFATEADAYSFTVDTCYYLCTEILLAAPDPGFGATGVGANGGQQGATGTGSGPATAKNLHTPDNGLTWLVDLITIPAMYPQGTQTATPTYSCSSTVDAGADGSGGSGGTGDAGGSGGTNAGGAGDSGGTGGAGSSGGSEGVGDSGASGGSAGAGGSGGTSAGGAGGSGGTVGAGGSGGAGSDGGANGLDKGSPSGCGCRTAGNFTGRGGYPALIGIVGFAVVAGRRRSRRHALPR